MKIIIWMVMSISVSQTINPTIQHPAVKNIKMNPGIENSAIKNATPIRNHISEGEKFIVFSNLTADIFDDFAAFSTFGTLGFTDAVIGNLMIL